MKVHLTAKTVYYENGDIAGKMPDGNIRISNLPSRGRQGIHVDLLKPGGSLHGHVTQTPVSITVNTVDGPVPFKILEPPGRYCLTCGERLPDFKGNGTQEEADAAQACRDHVKAHGKDAEKSETWPHGYSNHSRSYLCEIEETPLTKRLMAAGD